MRHTGLLAIFAVFTVLFAVGCGGGGDAGGSSSPASVNGVWTGAYLGGVLSGTTLDSLGKTGAFRLEPGVGITTFHR